MVQGEDTISALIKFKADFGQATKSLEEYLNTTQTRVSALETKLAGMLTSKSKVSQGLIDNTRAELDILYKQVPIAEKLLETQRKRDAQATDRVSMLRGNFEHELKYGKKSSEYFSNGIKKQMIERNALNQEVLGWNTLLDQAHKKIADNEVKTTEATAKVTRAIRQEEFENKQKLLEKEAKANDRAYSKTLGGAITEGTTFGHKFATTAQYMAAGTALYGLASAFTAAGQAALEADLNMRTMSAVLNLNITQATELDKQVRKLGETYGGTTGEIEQVAIALGRAGIATKDVTKATEIVLAMARLTGDTFEQSSNAVISYQQVFGKTTSIQTLGDKLAYVANVSRLSTHDIGTFSNYALAAAKDVGLTEDAVGGLAAAFSNAGVNASTIGTQIRRFTTLLTDDSEAVTNFFRSIGVNQANLLASLQAGGKESNTALVEFVKTLQKVDKATFTGLTGQMDILAANSLQLMKNNASNISKFVQDLQTGVKGQLESTKVILDSFIVTYESMWNTLKNVASNGLLGLQDDLTQLGIGLNLIIGNVDKARVQSLALAQQKDDEALAMWRKQYEEKSIDIIKMNAMEEHFAQKRLTRADQLKKLTSSKATETRTDTERLADAEKIRDLQLTILDDTSKTAAEHKKAKEVLDTYVKTIRDIVQVQEQRQKEDTKSNISNESSYSNQLKFMNTLIDANQDYMETEKIFYAQTTKAKEKNIDLSYKQLDGLQNYSKAYSSVLSILNSSPDNASKLLTTINSRLVEIESTASNGRIRNELEKEYNVLKSIRSITEETQVIDKDTIAWQAKKDSLVEAAKRKLQEASDKALKTKEKEVNLSDRNEKALTSIAELQAQLTGETELTLGKAESKFAIDTQLVGLAYDQYIAAKGTRQEKEKEALFNEATVTYLKSSLGYVTKINEHEDKRKALSLELNSSLDQATETEEVRLGIIEKATDSEYEKLRVKIEQAKIDKTLTDAEIAGLEVKLAKLKQYQGQKKNVHTLAMEYQRQIADQEEMGYIAAKAGLESLESGMSDFFDVTSDGWLEWHSLATNVLNSIYKQLLEQLVIKQLVSGIAGGISGMFGTTTQGGTVDGVTSTAFTSSTPDYGSGGFSGNPVSFNALGGVIPSKGYASGGVLSGGTGIRDDIYLGNVGGTRVFAMGGEFITRKSSVNDETKGTLDYINKTGTTPNQGTQVAVPVSINIDNQTGQAISADMIESITKPNDKGEYEKVVSIILKASRDDARIRSILKGR